MAAEYRTCSVCGGRLVRYTTKRIWMHFLPTASPHLPTLSTLDGIED